MVLNNAGIKIATLIIMTTLMGLGMLLAYPTTTTIFAQENMTNTDQNMTELGYGIISGAVRGTQ